LLASSSWMGWGFKLNCFTWTNNYKSKNLAFKSQPQILPQPDGEVCRPLANPLTHLSESIHMGGQFCVS
jgi:hypothetical protein